MADRWAIPIKILAVENDSNSFARFSEGGGWYQGIRWITDEDRPAADPRRAGLPDVCRTAASSRAESDPRSSAPSAATRCASTSRNTSTSSSYEEEGVKLGGSTTISDELARLDHFADERAWKQGSSILLPRGVTVTPDGED